jgi:orotidine-5'-phosphate decarboxylase
VINKTIILALDVSDPGFALETVDRFGEHIDIFKVGLELFSSAGPSVVRSIHDRGKKVFLDLKLHDIPNTMARSARNAARLGVHMFNLHASAGLEAMKACRESVNELCARDNIEIPMILGVTVLTSIGPEMLRNEFGIKHSLRTHVKNLSRMSHEAGLDGVIASGHEVAMIKKHCSETFLTVTPGIRPSWSPPDDQIRTMTPRDAVREGADYLVIGRSIMDQEDSLKALDLILVEILTAR